jgi:hypothetical protein
MKASLARLSDRTVFTACLAGLVAGMGLFLVLPLAPQLLALHRCPPTATSTSSCAPRAR